MYINIYKYICYVDINRYMNQFIKTVHKNQFIYIIYKKFIIYIYNLSCVYTFIFQYKVMLSPCLHMHCCDMCTSVLLQSESICPVMKMWSYIYM